MITQYWLEKGISTLLFLIFIFLGYLSFGYPQYFDRLFFLLLLCLIVSYKRSPDLAAIGIIILVVRVSSETLFLYQGSYGEVICYAVSCMIIHKFKFDKHISFLLLPILVICTFAEIYWYLIGYKDPGLGFYVMLIAMNCWLRYLIIYRAHITKSFPNIKLSGISLDYDLYRLSGVSNVIVTVMIVEYLVRHLTPLNPLFIYEVYTYCLQLIAILFPYLVISYLIKSRFTITA